VKGAEKEIPMPADETGGHPVRRSAVARVKKAIDVFVRDVKAHEPGTQIYLAWQEKGIRPASCTSSSSRVSVGAIPALNHRHPAPLRDVCCAEVNDSDTRTPADGGARRPDSVRKVLDPHLGRVEEERARPPRILPPAPAPRIRILASEAGDSGA